MHVVFMLLPMLRGTGRERHGLILRNIAWLVEENKVRPLLEKAASRWKQRLTPTVGWRAAKPEATQNAT
jgi:hypothetical protein